MPKRISPAQREEIVLMLESQESTRLTDAQIGAAVSGGGVSGNSVARIRQSLREAYQEAQDEEAGFHLNGNGHTDPTPTSTPFHATLSPFPPIPLADRLPRVADTKAPPPPPGGPVPDMSPADAARMAKDAGVAALPSLTEGTAKFLDEIGGPVATIVVATLNWMTPDAAKPAIPTADLAKIMLVAPARILARHTHLAIDELSDDGRDIGALVTAIGAWALEVRANYAELARQRRGEVPASRYDRPSENEGSARPTPRGADRAGSGYPSGTVTQPDRPGTIPADSANFFEQFAIRGAASNAPASSAPYPERGPQSGPADTAFGRAAISQLYQVDAIGRRQSGLQ